MPGLNRKGPEGKGSRTGRGMGKCNPDNKNSDVQNNLEERPAGQGRGKGGEGLGLGRRRGKGFGRGNS